MTVIVWDGKTLAADKQATDDGIKKTVTKIRRVKSGPTKGCLVAGSGPCGQANAMMDWYEQGADPDLFPMYQENEQLGAILTVITPDKKILRYEYCSTPIVFEDAQYCTGSGREVAYGALALGADAVTAVSVACDYFIDCGMGIDKLTLKGKK
jgi:hypothetical protein